MHAPSSPASRGAAVAAALCLTVPAALNTAFHLLSPLTAATLPGVVDQAAASPGQAVIAACLQVALPVLGIGILALAGRAAAGSPRLALIGGGLLAGALLLGALGVAENLVEAIAPAVLGRAAALRMIDSVEGGLVGQLAFLLVIAQSAGIVVLGIALWRSRAVPRWVGACFVLTVPLQVATHGGAGNTLPAVGWAWFTGVLVLCAIALVRVVPSRTIEAEAYQDETPTRTMSA